GVITVAGWAAIRSGMLEPARRDSPEYREKAALDARFEEAKKRPLYEIEVPDQGRREFRITIHEIRKDYLVTSVYEGQIAYTGELARSVGGRLDRLIISVRDKDMNRIGKPCTLAIAVVMPLPLDADNRLNTQELAAELALGEIEIKKHDERVT